MEIISNSSSETEKLAFRIASSLKGGEVLTLYGDLGSGKTTFVKGLVKAFGIKASVISPTFVLMRHYKNVSKKERISVINHVDLYRITEASEILNLGVLDVIGSRDSVMVIEWPKLIESYLPRGFIKVEFEVMGKNKRRINVSDLH
ncbi:tRNA (adenosine(37)-N6)-threonylcarbamoyltransferase complex ATPase subunit type 1 TsaE [candidate division WWE3 bacterium RIFCSPHIGHO2_01_FULL_40_23]|uniref:tRNA threonylcarbamoyladenosine biosynthesis protein TsaE n=1 Tax=candidate division WWE3 bacterium RIFCSPLOWO2_01_FULL_41_18 TaxID=1802625 RepID=A0A1F4VD35_UNCKA|nr:MAG: tRNA (adenosine(37)-N6)-threonylcarbamoyltransferase complex ATPase subunit type 1 TsaE [candidate division WWE3 bacterium RIFCSPHIGHO2_01_FULL_40_23]OGC55131.1 MAG: tRNA (adenosine(37)-N6)-threonylcarbamoyltransferase complex ATPase subunit type 1 TsaE [candidate division WWE3 bacterium RIFCSPLOWO2_01_FULL_41_18]